MTGTLNMADMASASGRRGRQHARRSLAALAFLTVGISLKLALFPLHLWLPERLRLCAVRRSRPSSPPPPPRSRSTCWCASTSPCSARRRLRAACRCGDAARACRSPRMFVASASRSSRRPQADVRLFARGADRLHHPRPRSRQRRPDSLAASCTSFNHARHEGRDLPAARRRRLSRRQARARRSCRASAQMPLTSAGLRDLRALRYRHARNGRLHQQVVSGASARSRRGWWWLVFLIVASSLLAIVYVWRFVEAPSSASPRAPRRGGQRAAADMLLPSAGARGGDDLLRLRHRVHRRHRGAGRATRCSEGSR